MYKALSTQIRRSTVAGFVLAKRQRGNDHNLGALHRTLHGVITVSGMLRAELDRMLQAVIEFDSGFAAEIAEVFGHDILLLRNHSAATGAQAGVIAFLPCPGVMQIMEMRRNRFHTPETDRAQNNMA